jgi:hypothetical protein
MGCSAGRGGVGPSSRSLREMGIGRVTASFTTSSVRSDPYRLFVPTVRRYVRIRWIVKSACFGRTR